MVELNCRHKSNVKDYRSQGSLNENRKLDIVILHLYTPFPKYSTHQLNC